ncbi:response regulator [Actinophytocola algeriensis]|uniref:DNA-binding NarL/FixJ family response regulator n=1 Tax=Actinophytocola algeriensis TaxID=1768010 RepID=A0A7W7PZH3_9PSEU|nr:response regulator transcription factor [Actinophytocola algeriensis]MBB4904205.1 DNA-binding NarL/FixJ family response regulator [Actinophytocola algeriensis]MBE1476938.1 DNA-binding NarL/FixJ family response regulator [Actinophytocola algeriensis]
MAERTRVVIVDDHTIVREGLRSILELEPDITVVGHAASPAEALSTVAATQPDVVLLDLKLDRDGPVTGLTLCGDLVARHPAASVVVLTTFHDRTLVMEALRRGAKGYVLKDVDVVDLLKIIRGVRTGSLMVHVASEPDSPRLTRRELEIMRLLARGLTNREIGKAALISDSTVKFHVRGIMRKLAVHHRAEVVYAATKLGIL